MQSENVPTAIYVRLSSDRTGDEEGVGRQEEECREYLSQKLPGHTLVEVYRDNDISATSGKRRPNYLRMLEDIRSGRIGAVVAWHADRLHRSPVELEAYIDAGAPTYLKTAGQWDLATPAGRMVARQLGAVAKYEVEQKALRQQSKNRQSAKAGKMASGPVPFGYEADRLTVQAEQGQMVREAYRALMSGSSLGSVIRLWNASDYPAPRGGRWSYSTVRGVLLRALNCGLVQHDGVILAGVRGNWEPLVSDEEYYGLKALLENPARRTTSGRARRHLLVGLIACESCGQTMKSGSVRSRGRQSLLYRCGNAACTKPLAVARERVNEHVVGRFLTERGSLRTVRLVTEDNGAALADVEARIAGVTARLGQDDANVVDLMERLDNLKSERASLRSSTGSLSVSSERVAQEWAKAVTVVEKAELLRSHLAVLSVAPRGKTSHRFDPERVTIKWADVPDSTLDGRPLVRDEEPEGLGMIGPIVLRIGDWAAVVGRPGEATDIPTADE